MRTELNLKRICDLEKGDKIQLNNHLLTADEVKDGQRYFRVPEGRFKKNSKYETSFGAKSKQWVEVMEKK